MSRFWNAQVHDLHPYIPGEQPRISNLLKLNTNESPYGPSPRAKEAVCAAATDDLRLYPDPLASDLRATIAKLHDTSPDNVFVGNGSDEVLAHVFRGLFHDDAPLFFSDVTYGFYPVFCGLFRQQSREFPLTPDFRIDITAYDTQEERDCGGIIVANPNANTGLSLSLDEIESLARRHPNRVVVIDEAYVDFGAESAIPLTKTLDNLLVVQTLSKSYALAGLRVGFAIGSAELIEGLNRVKDSFNSYPLSRTSQAGAIAALEDQAWLKNITNRVQNTRDSLIPALENLGFQVLPSCANFILVRHSAHPAGTLAAQLRERAILVRHLSTPRIRDWLRITIGTDEDSTRLTDTLKDLLQPQS
ncbi:histidinol phosphate aminotransferase [Neokomagataea thailandica NBRC 106555]|uniref:Histidinol-phosphate aminotransferase n=2 Tax=Neokomagataea TaxID=1223423 RepID=A0A4Y6VA44_9PROT|nr:MULTISPECIES: histidinol-phosphate transaminase [Neokomagataea]QDH25327.1 histidinol-phosphate transaminase [Neokomagataea tanensis]GBR52530.1 histidinol phosphate aminotransferase [Neokomagataea thailandica NBRC 106555]